MEYSGHAAEWDRRRRAAATPSTREFIAFWLREDRVIAGMNVNVWDVTDDIQALIRAGAAVDRALLADPQVALAELLPATVRER